MGGACALELDDASGFAPVEGAVRSTRVSAVRVGAGVMDDGKLAACGPAVRARAEQGACPCVLNVDRGKPTSLSVDYRSRESSPRPRRGSCDPALLDDESRCGVLRSLESMPAVRSISRSASSRRL